MRRSFWFFNYNNDTSQISPFFFTERLTSAFLSQTIPVYLGATALNKFFNMDGIITFSQTDDMQTVLKQCTPEEYQRRLPALLDNFNRVMQFLNPWDYMYLHYFK